MAENVRSRSRLLIWGIPTLLYGLFVGWYTDFGGPLGPDEIEAYVGRFEAIGFAPEAIDRMRGFMESDTGRQFLMLNVVDYAADPPDVPGASPGESAEQLMARYMEHMIPALLSRACHPTIIGNAVHRAIDLVGVDALETAERWDMGAMFRYRSRRTLLEIVTNPAFGGKHAFKTAALDKTIAYPIETDLNLGDPRVSLGLLLLSIALALDLISTRAALARASGAGR